MASDRKILQIDPKTLQIVGVIQSIKKLSKITNISDKTLRKDISNNKQINGYIWRYYDYYIRNNYIRGFVHHDNVFKCDIIDFTKCGSLSRYKYL